jgi:hypothetical protein
MTGQLWTNCNVDRREALQSAQGEVEKMRAASGSDQARLASTLEECAALRREVAQLTDVKTQLEAALTQVAKRTCFSENVFILPGEKCDDLKKNSIKKSFIANFPMVFLTRYSSVADPGCFILDPDPTIALSRISGEKAPDPGSDLFLYKGY